MEKACKGEKGGYVGNEKFSLGTRVRECVVRTRRMDRATIGERSEKKRK